MPSTLDRARFQVTLVHDLVRRTLLHYVPSPSLSVDVLDASLSHHLLDAFDDVSSADVPPLMQRLPSLVRLVLVHCADDVDSLFVHLKKYTRAEIAFAECVNLLRSPSPPLLLESATKLIPRVQRNSAAILSAAKKRSKSDVRFFLGASLSKEMKISSAWSDAHFSLMEAVAHLSREDENANSPPPVYIASLFAASVLLRASKEAAKARTPRTGSGGRTRRRRP